MAGNPDMVFLLYNGSVFRQTIKTVAVVKMFILLYNGPIIHQTIKMVIIVKMFMIFYMTFGVSNWNKFIVIRNAIYRGFRFHLNHCITKIIRFRISGLQMYPIYFWGRILCNSDNPTRCTI